ncbi:MAG: DMT family transporter [Peptococcaceae bacterium]
MKNSPYLLLVLAPLFLSANFLIGKVIAGTVPPGALTFLRWLISFIVILPFFGRELLKNKILFIKNWPLMIILGLTGYFFNSLGTYLAVTYTTAINASFIASLNPIAFALFGFVFYKEKAAPLQIIGIVISLTGVLWIIFKGNIADILSMRINSGDGFMLIAVISWAIYSNILKKKEANFPWPAIFITLVFSGIIVSIPYVILETSLQGWNWLGLLGAKDYLCILAVGIIPSLLAFYCWNKALSHVESNQAAIFLNLIPVFTTILSIIIFKEELMYYHLLGGLLIFSGVLLVTNYQVLTRNIKARYAGGK